MPGTFVYRLVVSRRGPPPRPFGWGICRIDSATELELSTETFRARHEAIDDGEPVGAVGDVGRGPAEQADDAAVGQRCPRHKVDEDFRGGLIESDERDLLARCNAQIRDAEGAEAVIVLRDL